MTKACRAAAFAAVAPYAAWMALMTLLPAAAWAYALRSAATAAILLFAIVSALRGRVEFRPGGVAALAWGVAAGLAVFALWVWPERFEWYRRFLTVGASAVAESSPYSPAVCGWHGTTARLLGSAFVIPVAEELFFRSFLYRWLQKGEWTEVDPSKFDFSAFLWTVALFAVEHNRIAAGAAAGAVYGLLAVKKGLGAAIVAHATTNLVLGLYVIRSGLWGFW